MSSNAFKVAVQIDGEELDRVNRYLSRMAVPAATKAMKSGFRAWFKKVRATAKQLAPFGVNKATEKVRGQEKPNPHVRDNLTYKVIGYSKGRVVWGALGVKEIRGSYMTPHWYLRWIEFGHDIRRKPYEGYVEMGSQAVLSPYTGEVRRYKRRKFTTAKVGRVPGQFFIRRAYEANVYSLLPLMQEAISAQMLKEWDGRG